MSGTLESINDEKMNLLKVELTKENINTMITMGSENVRAMLFKAKQASIVSLKDFASLFKGSENLKFSVGDLKTASPSDGMCKSISLGKVDFGEGANTNNLFKTNWGLKSYLSFRNGVIVGCIVLGLAVAGGLFYYFVTKSEKKEKENELDALI